MKNPFINFKKSILGISKMNKIVLFGTYRLERVIGKGSFSKIYKATNVYTNKVCAIKKLKCTTKYKKIFEREIEILRDLKHPNIINLIEVVKTKSEIYIITDFYNNGDLSTFISKSRDPNEPFNSKMDLLTLNGLAKQLCQGIKYLRENNIIHRDLKPQNLFLDNCGVLKIGDFGLSKNSKMEDMSTTLCGSPIYMAPEIIFFKEYNTKADLWSVGIILYQLVFGITPYKAKNILELQKEISNLSIEGIPFPNTKLTEQIEREGLKDLILKLLVIDPEKRISFEEFFTHPYFDSISGRSTQKVKFDIQSESRPQSESQTSICLQSESEIDDYILVDIPKPAPLVTYKPKIEPFKKIKGGKFVKDASTCIDDQDSALLNLETTLIHVKELLKLSTTLKSKEKNSILLRLLDLTSGCTLNFTTNENTKYQASKTIKEISGIWFTVINELKKSKNLNQEIDESFTNEIIYAGAIKFGKGGISEEFLKLYSSAIESYQTSSVLFEILLFIDKDIIKNKTKLNSFYISLINRITICKNKIRQK